MSEINRRSCLKVVSIAALPHVAGRSTAFQGREQQNDYVESETVLDEVGHFPHPDEGDIVTSEGKFLYVDIREGTKPDPMNSWLESHEGKHPPLTYPKTLWLDGSIKHTIWAEMVDNQKEFFVDHGMLFPIPPGSKDVSLYVGGEKQQLENHTRTAIRREGVDFSLREVSHETMNDKTRLSIDVRNNLDRNSTFRACVNVTNPLLYTKFIVEEVTDGATIEDEVFHGAGASPEDVEIELITSYTA